MRLLRWILIAVATTLAVIAAVVYWIAPVALSIDAARTASPITRVVPTDLKDRSVSQTPGVKLSYLGYEFEIPWNDLDETKTKYLSKSAPHNGIVGLVFISGHGLIVSASPPRVFFRGLEREWKTKPKDFDTVFGGGASRFDYNFLSNIYEFTPDHMHLWAISPSVHFHERFLLMTKQVVLFESAGTGIFRVEKSGFQGFQLGDPTQPGRIIVQLYSSDGNVEFWFSGKNIRAPAGITQPEINRLVESLRAVSLPQTVVKPQVPLHQFGVQWCYGSDEACSTEPFPSSSYRQAS